MDKLTMEEITSDLKVLLDLRSLPHQLTLDQFFNIMKASGIIVWDSTQGGQKPELVHGSKLSLMDVAYWPKEQFDEQFNNIIE